MLRFAALGSGSEGNGIVIEAAGAQGVSRVLLDCGFTLKALEERLGKLSLTPNDIDAVFITHEHSDHSAGGLKAAKRYGWPLYTTAGTRRAAYANDDYAGFHDVCPNTVLRLGALSITPIAVPHDAREPVQFRFDTNDATDNIAFAVLTDIGSTTPYVTQQLQGLDALVLECNHCSALLSRSAYPQSLKNRISGNWGHLSNAQAAQLLGAIKHPQLQAVWCAHLSKQNNAPELAREALLSVVSDIDCEVSVLSQDEPSAWFEVSAYRNATAANVA